ncbi:Transmembrane emp24 domain-containing protein p24beta3 [Capsicum chinense]|nr:Transmembrane emp24 domain-containing protein p24beta3 [Capsicum chinense]
MHCVGNQIFSCGYHACITLVDCTFGRHCNVKIAELKQALESVTSEQKYLRAHHARHCHTSFRKPSLQSLSFGAIKKSRRHPLHAAILFGRNNHVQN